MKVSVVIPYYNDRKYLAQAIESVLNQTLADFELILINHATTDDSREIAHSFQDSRIVHIDMERNNGAGTGLLLEKALEVAQGEYIKLFCADDCMKPLCLEELVNYMETHTDKDFAFGNVEYIDDKGKSLNTNFFKNRHSFDLQNDEIECLKLFLQGYSFLPYIGNIIKKSALDKIPLNKSMIMLLDVTFWVYLLLNNCKIGYLNKIIADYRIHTGQMSSIKKLKKIETMSEFEYLAYFEIFIKNIKDINLLKQLFSNNPFLNNIDTTEDDIEFIVSYEMLNHLNESARKIGYIYIHNMLENAQKREYLRNKFNFGIEEFRAMYSTVKLRAFDKVSDLTYPKLFYLTLKKILRTLSLSKIKNLISKKRRYSA